MRGRIVGIDFSGARDACRRIWLAEGLVKESKLEIGHCVRAGDLSDSGDDRQVCYRAVRDYLTARNDALVGLDFPFGLPERIVGQWSWKNFLLTYAHRFDRPEALRRHCRNACPQETKRKTDLLTQTPFSPYNLRLYKQTHYGIKEILAPLVRTQKAVVLPMQRQNSHLPWLIEICPASTLKKRNLYLPYKGRSDTHKNARHHILQKICKAESLVVKKRAIKKTVVQDCNGDALDSLIAAAAAYTALKDMSKGLKPPMKIRVEGWVYV
jgi:hypothetical protein